MKKLLSYLLVIALVLVQFMPLVSAANGKNNNSGQITITNPAAGEDYKVYQILKLESYDTDKEAYTYKSTDLWKDFVESSTGQKYLSTDPQGYVTWVENADVKAFSRDALAWAKQQGIVGIEPTTNENNVVKFENLNLGYYLVDSTLGALCGLTTTEPTATVREKNQIPTVKKEVKEAGVYGEENNVKIGDKVEYKTTVYIQKGAVNYVLHDTMEAGLTFNNDVKVFVNNEPVTASADTYQVTKEGNDTFTVKFDDQFVFDLVGDYEENYVATEIVVTYSATVNENAELCKEEACNTNDNETYLTYGDKSTQSNHDLTKTYTYEFELEKTDGTDRLQGAQFKLYDAETNGNEIKVFQVSDGVYRVAYTDAEKAQATTIVVGLATIEGLDANVKYYLEETVAPDGYNLLAKRQEITLHGHTTVTEGDTTTTTAEKNEVKVVNNKGTILPSTGGMGTVLFVTVGSIMVLGFGVLLVTKLRLSKMSI